MSGILYIVGTPIGNLDDISKRAIDTLNLVDFIIAEDCRVTLKLLNKYSIKKPLYSFHKFSDVKRAKYLIEKIKSNETAALVSDAGMPCVADPGEILVKLCHENKISLKVVPGPCALVAALCFSGLDCGRFTFFGFLSKNLKKKLEDLMFLKNIPHTIILYESPHRLVDTLNLLVKYFKDRVIVVVKEITKIYESAKVFSVCEAAKYYENEKSLKGEYVLIMEGAKENVNKNFSLDEAINLAKQFVDDGEKLSIAAKKVANISNFKKNDIYKAIIKKF